MNLDQPIDAVIPWVDGADPAHAAKLAAFLGVPVSERPRGAHPDRFHSSGELDYCVTSLLRFAPWIRRIFIVTDAQVPAIVGRIAATAFSARVEVVDHTVIFSGLENYLPTFNSNSISTVLHRVPGLSDRFLYLNDDFALLRPVAPEDFFTKNGVVLRGQWRVTHERLLHKRIKQWLLRVLGRGKQQEAGVNRFSYLRGQQASARLAGYDERYFQIGHNPHPWRVSTLSSFYAGHPAAVDLNLRTRVRSPEQFVIESLAAHLELKHEAAHVDNRLRTLQLKPGDQGLTRIRHKLSHADADPNLAFVCIQNLERGPIQVQQEIFNWLDRRVGSVEQLAAG